MTARQPRRTRRRMAPASSLPRPLTAEDTAAGRTEVRGAAPLLHHRTHHVTKDYSYIHKDLLTVAVLGTGVIGFIIAMSFVVS
ncbi:MAG: hypothetical protein ABI577_06360 [bacterium]